MVMKFGRCFEHVLSAHKKTPQEQFLRGFWYKCLTMTYFHRRPSTIIGAKAFHGPVRDGKEWGHFAMVVKRNWCVLQRVRATRPISEEAP